MAKIHINNPKQVINGGAKKYYFKVKGLGGPKGDKGDTGATGPQGPQGPQGNAATVSVGSTTTLPVGYDATVTNSGSIYNAVLNFGIPQGPRGPQGATGATGAKGDKGDQGNPGPQGEKGTNATVYVGTTSTLNPGSQATVYNSGTDSNAVLNFGIPKGEKGDTGPMPTIAQTTGQAIDQVMSQKATTDALNTKQATITSSNKLSADLVEDTSTTNKFVTASDITNWNGKQDALTAGTGIDITSGVISTPAIVPEVVTELPTTGAEGKLYLTPKAHTTSTATGNPIEATVTEQAGQLESFQLDGDTFQQTYAGKNLLDVPNISATSSGVEVTVNNCVIGCSGKVTSSWGFNIAGGNSAAFPKALPAGDYAVSINKAVDIPMKVVFVDSESQTIGTATISAGNTSVAYTISREAVEATVWSNAAQNTQVDISGLQIMVESGSSATSFEPFVGGQASPNPDYPQQIQTVTGTQTISINGTDYPISLGTIELCKLGAYQDYIYKDGESWKVHKAVEKLQLVSSQGWAKSSTMTTLDRYFIRDCFPSGTIPSDLSAIVVWSNYFTAISQSASDSGSYGICQLNGRGLMINTALGAFSSNDAFKNWLDSNSVNAYYALATATDTTITDTNLIAQLEAIRTASLQNGANTITNTATGTNLAGDMEIGYYGFNPRNRYDKWLWLDINNEYEQIGG